jgi:hypothetical protein
MAFLYKKGSRLIIKIDYSCAYKARQGWIYISENYIGFHSFLLGTELKVLIELKDIQEIKKEKSKGIFDDSLRLITKKKQEVKATLYAIIDFNRLKSI